MMDKVQKYNSFNTNTLSSESYKKVRDQVLRPYKAAGIIIVFLYFDL